MLALGVDVATRTGWAVVESAGGREELLDHGIVDASAGNLYDQVSEVLDKAGPCALVALERPYYAHDNPQTLEVLARLVGYWEHAAAYPFHEVLLVRASQWQRSILTGLITNASKREQRKKAARMWCKATFGLDLSDDEADAAAIATWACRTRLAASRGLLGR